jgi:hypothetical protein
VDRRLIARLDALVVFTPPFVSNKAYSACDTVEEGFVFLATRSIRNTEKVRCKGVNRRAGRTIKIYEPIPFVDGLSPLKSPAGQPKVSIKRHLLGSILRIADHIDHSDGH